MAKDKSIYWIIGVIVVIVILAVFLFYSTQNKGTIKIGVLTPLTGSVAEYGQNAKNGIDLAVEEINKEGGIGGAKIQLFYEDSKCDPKEALNAFSKLTDISGVNIILGTICSSETLAIAPTSNQKQILVVSIAATSPEITNAGDYIFRVYPSDDYEAGIAAKAIYNALKKVNVSILYLNNDYGQALQNTFKKQFLALGGKVLDEESYLQDSKDLRTQLIKIKDKNPQVVYMISYPIDGAIAVKQAKELGLNAIFFGTSGIKANDFISNGGDATEGLILPALAVSSGAKRDAFVSSYQNKFNSKPGFVADNAYDSVYAIKMAFKGAKTIEAVKNNLYNVNFEGASGVISFDSNGDLKEAKSVLWIVKNGQFVPYEG